MILTRGCLLLIAVAVLATAVPVLPHHPVGQIYDESQTVTLEGEIVRLVYRNPHSLLHLQVADRGGVDHTWAIEWRGADRLRHRGVGPETLRPGDRVVVCGNPGRDPGQYRLWLLTLSRPEDGWSTATPSCRGV